MLVVFRHARWDTPWWANNNRSPGRYNAAGHPPIQYWCTHPLGPAAEFLRWQGPLPANELRDVRLRLWVAKVDSDELIRVDFDNAPQFDIGPDALVGEDYEQTQQLAARLRAEGVQGLMVPSAALPGTEIVVLFGPRLLFPYALEPMDEEQVPTAHVADGPPPGEVLDHVRWRGDEHASLVEWRATGRCSPFLDPPIGG